MIFQDKIPHSHGEKHRNLSAEGLHNKGSLCPLWSNVDASLAQSDKKSRNLAFTELKPKIGQVVQHIPYYRQGHEIMYMLHEDTFVIIYLFKQSTFYIFF